MLQQRGNNGMHGQGDDDVFGLRKDTIIRIDGIASDGDTIIDKSQIETFGDVAGDRTVIQLKRASCGHVLHHSSDLGAVTPSGQALCAKCAQEIRPCHRCHEPLYYHDNQVHRTKIKRGALEVIYCDDCWHYRFFDDWEGSTKRLLIVVLILLFLKWLSGC